jgi:DNA-directed RNA polymerase subunit RPC12/RpoP
MIRGNMNKKLNSNIEKCMRCGKKEASYFGYCTYTCWKKDLDKSDKKPNCPICGFKMSLDGVDAKKTMYRCGKCNYSNWKKQIMKLKCNECGYDLGFITIYKIPKEIWIKLQEPIYCEKCTK